jgi:ketosteroid isomerase-like protein
MDDGFVMRLAGAVSAHDIDAIVDCFAPDYRNETPAHPGRGFAGRDQVRANWSRLLAGVPDITAIVLASAIDGSTIWSEWELRGTRRDGQPHLMRGVIVFESTEGRAAAGRFYLEPVDAGEGGVDAAISRLVEAEPAT